MNAPDQEGNAYFVEYQRPGASSRENTNEHSNYAKESFTSVIGITADGMEKYIQEQENMVDCSRIYRPACLVKPDLSVNIPTHSSLMLIPSRAFILVHLYRSGKKADKRNQAFQKRKKSTPDIYIRSQWAATIAQRPSSPSELQASPPKRRWR